MRDPSPKAIERNIGRAIYVLAKLLVAFDEGQLPGLSRAASGRPARGPRRGRSPDLTSAEQRELADLVKRARSKMTIRAASQRLGVSVATVFRASSGGGSRELLGRVRREFG